MKLVQMIVQTIRHWHQSHVLTGVFLLMATLAAMVMNNSSWHDGYHAFQHMYVTIKLGAWQWQDSLFHVVNDGLMVFFFFLVGCELKKEMLYGSMTDSQSVRFPLVCAIGGMLVPALIFTLWNYNQVDAMNAWAVPTATDIAFALGVLSLLGQRVPKPLWMFLMALAVYDDLGAIIIIGLFYSKKIQVLMLLISAAIIVFMLWLKYMDIRYKFPYIVAALCLWWTMTSAGLHGTLDGVIAAFCFPSDLPEDYPHEHQAGDALRMMIRSLAPTVNYGILPLFAFINAGLDLSIFQMDSLTHPVVMGVFLGLVVGKPLGVMIFAWLGHVLGVVEYPKHLDIRHLLGVACLCGIGFTMSLFICDLAFDEALDSIYNPLITLGILAGSLFSGILGYALLAYSAKKSPSRR